MRQNRDIRGQYFFNSLLIPQDAFCLISISYALFRFSSYTIKQFLLYSISMCALEFKITHNKVNLVQQIIINNWSYFNNIAICRLHNSSMCDSTPSSILDAQTALTSETVSVCVWFCMLSKTLRLINSLETFLLLKFANVVNSFDCVYSIYIYIINL